MIGGLLLTFLQPFSTQVLTVRVDVRSAFTLPHFTPSAPDFVLRATFQRSRIASTIAAPRRAVDADEDNQKSSYLQSSFVINNLHVRIIDTAPLASYPKQLEALK